MQTILTASEVEGILDYCNLEYHTFRNTYSGRYMYGEWCIGFDLDSAKDIAFIALAAAEFMGEDEVIEFINTARTDSMGMGIIVYFPGYTCPEWNEDEWED